MQDDSSYPDLPSLLCINHEISWRQINDVKEQKTRNINKSDIKKLKKNYFSFLIKPS